jgi:hypothetical protein
MVLMHWARSLPLRILLLQVQFMKETMDHGGEYETNIGNEHHAAE